VKSLTEPQPCCGVASGPVDVQWYDDGREQPPLLLVVVVAAVVGRDAGCVELAKEGCEGRDPDDGPEPARGLPVVAPVVVPAADTDGEPLVAVDVATGDELPATATAPAWGEPLEPEHAASVTAEAATATNPTVPRNALRTR
jgi:hypothetical protein